MAPNGKIDIPTGQSSCGKKNAQKRSEIRSADFGLFHHWNQHVDKSIDSLKVENCTKMRKQGQSVSIWSAKFDSQTGQSCSGNGFLKNANRPRGVSVERIKIDIATGRGCSGKEMRIFHLAWRRGFRMKKSTYQQDGAYAGIKCIFPNQHEGGGSKWQNRHSNRTELLRK